MSDVQLYLAIGIPAGLIAISFIAVLWQSRGLERAINVRFDALDKVIDAKFKVVDAKFESVYAKFESAHQDLLRVEQVMDARVRHLEQR